MRRNIQQVRREHPMKKLLTSAAIVLSTSVVSVPATAQPESKNEDIVSYQDENNSLTFAFVDLINEFNFGLSTAGANLKPNTVYLCEGTPSVISDNITISIAASGRVSLTFFSAPSETPNPCPPTGNVVKFEGKCPGVVCDVSSFFKIDPTKPSPKVTFKSL
jgi:hypothetical protein